MSSTIEVSEAALQQLAGKFMTFKLATEEYSIEILKVRDVIALMEITRVPRTKDYVRGVINLRGKVIPVVDLRLKFGMGRTESTDQTVIIVVQCETASGEITRGVLVDEVLEVLEIGGGSIEPRPSFGAGSDEMDFIMGIGKHGDRVIFLLDIGKVLTNDTSRLAELGGVA